MATTGPQNHDSDKRKKHSADRAKAVHLTRQLQLRLQYAKLKVDHGWQRQNLNEVENLYFHHSHIRGPLKPQATLPTLDSNHESGSINTPLSSSCIEPTSEVNTTATSLSSAMQRRGSLVQIDVPTRPPMEEAFTNSALVPPAQQQSSHLNSHFGASIQGSWNDKVVPRPLPQAPAPSNHSTSQQHTISSLPTNAPNTALTYDSFWSNHNTTRPFRSSFFNMLSSPDIETSKITTQALLSELSGKNIHSYLSNLPGLTSDFITSSPSPPSNVTPTIRRTVPVASTIVEGLNDR